MANQAQLHDCFEDGVADARNCVPYLNPHPPESKAWNAYDSGYRSKG